MLVKGLVRRVSALFAGVTLLVGSGCASQAPQAQQTPDSRPAQPVAVAEATPRGDTFHWWHVFGGMTYVAAPQFEVVVAPAPVVEQRKPDLQDKNLENDEIGNNPDLPTNYNIERLKDVEVPGPINPNEMVGILNQVEPPPRAVPPPRLGPAGEKFMIENGGNAQSEGAVAAGLKYLARTQAIDGSWQLDGKVKDPIAGTALGLLPFLGAGETHKGAGKNNLYPKNVERGLKFLLTNQGADGKLGDNILAHALATMALCESYGLTADPILKGACQRALNYLVAQQKPAGNWEGNPAGAGRAAALGAWQLYALKSAQLAGLNVPNATLIAVNKHLDEQATKDGIAKNADSAPSYLLCRMFMGWGPRHPAIAKGILLFAKRPPDAKLRDIEYLYFGAQVLRHLGGEAWDAWNPLARNLLIERQDQGMNPDKQELGGSWAPDGDALAAYGGRHMQTALALLSLEVYYRHLPLYRRELGKLPEMK